MWLQVQLTGIGILVLLQVGYAHIDISKYRLLFGFFLLYTDRVAFELLDSAALL
jgi:hypothetical protein